jgi:hypothetical protein
MQNMDNTTKRRLGLDPTQYSHLLGRRWNDLEVEQQAHVRSLMRAGLVSLRCDGVPLAGRYVVAVQPGRS